MNESQKNDDMSNGGRMQQVRERLELAGARLSGIPAELSAGRTDMPEAYASFFCHAAEKLCKLSDICSQVRLCKHNNACAEMNLCKPAAGAAGDCSESVMTCTAGGRMEERPLEELQALNRELYADVLPEHYAESFSNPVYAAARMGKDMGQCLSFLQAEINSVVQDAFMGDAWEILIRQELLLEVYGAFESALSDTGDIPKPGEIRDRLYWYASDYSDEQNEKRIRALVDADCEENQFFLKIITESDLGDPRYLYRYGCYITENELRTAEYLYGLPEETIALMANTYTEGYRIGFAVGNKNLSKKETVNIRYCAGFERVVKRAIENFERMGLRPVIYRASDSIFHKKGVSKIGFYGAVPNKQYDYDHREDDALFYDGNYKTRKLETLAAAYELVKEKAGKHAGPACIEVFGENPFSPVDQPEAPRLSSAQQKLKVEYANAAGRITDQYIPGKERSFTIIAFPVPEIGEKYEEIFDEIIRINTLDYQLYADIQSKLIDALDEAEYVHIIGRNGNRTDLKVQLCRLHDPARETKFENCVADVNIPVGEVFTSPVLKGTNGILHVSGVYLNELYYENLEIRFADGFTESCSCSNFEDEEANRRYLGENVLFHHDRLPLGEFAIGTNTTAYMAARKYGIADKLPILIAEKMGPHFAVGDTCYSHAEDVSVYNPDGKEIIARDNEVSILRKEDASKAYFNCHTDITIPYDELGSLCGYRADGGKIEIIRDGRFVLAGCEKLNEPFDADRRAG